MEGEGGHRGSPPPCSPGGRLWSATYHSAGLTVEGQHPWQLVGGHLASERDLSVAQGHLALRAPGGPQNRAWHPIRALEMVTLVTVINKYSSAEPQLCLEAEGPHRFCPRHRRHCGVCLCAHAATQSERTSRDPLQHKELMARRSSTLRSALLSTGSSVMEASAFRVASGPPPAPCTVRSQPHPPARWLRASTCRHERAAPRKEEEEVKEGRDSPFCPHPLQREKSPHQ